MVSFIKIPLNILFKSKESNKLFSNIYLETLKESVSRPVKLSSDVFPSPTGNKILLRCKLVLGTFYLVFLNKFFLVTGVLRFLIPVKSL